MACRPRLSCKECEMKQAVVSVMFAVLFCAAGRRRPSRGRPKSGDASWTFRDPSSPGVTVTVRNQDTGMYRETVSGSDGAFIASGIVPGRYQVVAELQGFKKFDRKDLVLEVGKTVTIEVGLEVGSVSETVNVSAETPLVDVTSKEIGGNITSDTLVQAPERQRQLHRLHRPAAGYRALVSAPSRSAATRSASTDRTRATTTTASTAGTTTTT